MQREIKIFVAAHKPYRMPDDGLYVPIHVGAKDRETLFPTTDASGENISQKNEAYCELTALYWIWKNCQTDYVGLVHYRRHFRGRLPRADRWRRIVSQRELQRLLDSHPVILPKKRHYVIETNQSHYAHAHDGKDLDVARACIESLYPEYLPAFDRMLLRTSGHRFNMMIMPKQMLDAYCAWLFDVLFQLETRIDTTDYSAYQRRVFGFIGERLLDVWLDTNKIHYTELSLVNMEPVNWLKKGARFLKRKFTGHKQR